MTNEGGRIDMAINYVHRNKCTGGKAFKEIDGNIYCLGQTDAAYEDVVYVPECKKCPRLLSNNDEKIEEYAKTHCYEVCVEGESEEEE